MSFLDDIPGIKDVIDGTGTSPVTLPRRHKVKVLGSVTAVDNPATKTTELTFGLAEAVPIVNIEHQGSVPETAGAGEGYTLLVDAEGDVYWGEGLLTYDLVDATQDGLAPTTEDIPEFYVLKVDDDGSVYWGAPPQLVGPSRDGIVPLTFDIPEGYLLAVDSEGEAHWIDPTPLMVSPDNAGVVPATSDSSGTQILSHNGTGTAVWISRTTAHGTQTEDTLHAVAGPTAGGFVPRTAAGATGTAGYVPITDSGGVPVWGSLGSGYVENDSDVSSGVGSVTAALNTIKTALGLCLENTAMQVFTADGTYTPTSGMKKCLVILTGPGGGGGGADTDGSSSACAVGSGGGAGATQIKWFTAADIGASKAVVLPAGGGGGSTSGGDGSNGAANSTFGSTLLIAAFGAGGAAGSAGDINIAGGTGGEGFCASSATCTFASSGEGGISFWGTGGRSRKLAQVSLTTDLTSGGISATASHYGAGGGGAACLTAGTGVAGGDGTKGVCVVIEFIESAF